MRLRGSNLAKQEDKIILLNSNSDFMSEKRRNSLTWGNGNLSSTKCKTGSGDLHSIINQEKCIKCGSVG